MCVWQSGELFLGGNAATGCIGQRIQTVCVAHRDIPVLTAAQVVGSCSCREADGTWGGTGEMDPGE